MDTFLENVPTGYTEIKRAGQTAAVCPALNFIFRWILFLKGIGFPQSCSSAGENLLHGYFILYER